MRISDWSSDVCSSDLGRQLVDWLAARGPGEKTFELGGQEFVGRSATPTPESIGRVSRLVAMLRANTDVRVTIIGHTDPSGDKEADHALGIARAEALAQRLREGGVSRSEEHKCELQSLMRISYAVFCLNKKKEQNNE